MVADNRMTNKNGAGEDFDLSAADVFDYSGFYSDMQGVERLQVAKDEVTWMQSYRKPDKSADVVLSLSCGAQTTPHVMQTQVALFAALGVNFVATAGNQFCCGRVYQRFGRNEVGDRMAAKSINRFASWNAPTNVQCCGSCFIEFDYQVAKMAEDTGSAPFQVEHITRFVLDRLREFGDKLPWKDKKPRKPLRFLLHAEGAEVHPSKEIQRDDVLETMKLVPGAEFVGMVEVPSVGNPCATKGPGEPSVLNDITDEQYRQFIAELRTQATAAGADVILTHHHFCHREWSKFATAALPVIYYQTLIAELLGANIPDRFQALWRLGDPEEILAHSRPNWSSWGMSEEDAREMVRKHFVPRYASSVQRCPCEGSCFTAVAGSRPTGAVCGTSRDAAAPIEAA